MMRVMPIRLVGLLVLLGVLCPVSMSCRRSADPQVSATLVDQCVVLGTTDEERDGSGWTRWLNRHLPGAPRFTVERVNEATASALAEDRVLLVTGGMAASEAMTQALGDFLFQGGRLLVLGIRHPLENAASGDVRAAAGFSAPAFSATGQAFRVRGHDGPVTWPGRTVRSMVPGPMGSGGERAGDTRWIPLVEVLRDDGYASAWPGAVWLSPQALGRHAVAGWVGFDLARDEGRALIAPVSAILGSMTQPVYIQRYGLPYHAMDGKSPHHVHLRLVDRRMQDLVPLRLAVEWINERGQEVRRHISAPIDALTGQVSLNIGLAPTPSSGSEYYTLRFVVRDRNDQRTFDTAEQLVKVFANEAGEAPIEPVTVHIGQLAQGRRPVFLMGANYWPRLSVNLMDQNRHWLHPANFHPATVQQDLDQLASVGFNAIAFEYTDPDQAPQVRFVLDELRRRSMMASIYLPALNPLDLRFDDARVMLDAVRLKHWPEVAVLEIARGFAIPPRAERRRLDEAWRHWIEEHFNSVDEAELKLALTLWRERGRLAGPPDHELRRGPTRDRAVALYLCFLRDYVSRRIGLIRRWREESGYQVLLTARSAYGWPGDAPPDVLDVLDLSTGAIHLDLLFPDAWSVHPLRAMPSDGDLLAAYARGVAAGKPIVWSAYGQSVGVAADPSALQRQQEVFAQSLNQFIKHEASGAFAWWYPPGSGGPVREDWGLVEPSGRWRPVERALRAARLQIRQLRMQPRSAVRQAGPLLLAASQWVELLRDRPPMLAAATEASVTDWLPPGVGSDTTALLDPRFRRSWTDIDAFSLLNAEWGKVHVGGTVTARAPGDPLRSYTGRPVRAEIINSGALRWLGAPQRNHGSVWVRISQAGHQDEWLSVPATDRGDRREVTWMPREPGLWELQPFLIGYGKFGESLLVEASAPPRLF